MKSKKYELQTNERKNTLKMALENKTQKIARMTNKG